MGGSLYIYLRRCRCHRTLFYSVNGLNVTEKGCSLFRSLWLNIAHKSLRALFEGIILTLARSTAIEQRVQYLWNDTQYLSNINRSRSKRITISDYLQNSLIL